jgi:acyl carrier protein
LPGPNPTDDLTGEEGILEEMRTIIGVVIGEAYVDEIEIGRETSFYADLEIESIELVALGERLQDRYGDTIDFPAWIATMEVDDIIEMTVGRLVDHIAVSLGAVDSSEGTGTGNG